MRSFCFILLLFTLTIVVDLPYFVILKNIPKYFERIRQAKTPDDKFATDFVKNTLNFKSSNDLRLITVLKNMCFLDDSGHPLQLYKDFRSETTFPSLAIGKGLKNAFSSLYAKDVKIHEKDEATIKGHVIATTGDNDTSSTVRLITQSFVGLVKLSSFEQEKSSALSEEERQNLPIKLPQNNSGKFNLTHTIVLNLPTTTTKEVYDAIFKSLKENLS